MFHQRFSISIKMRTILLMRGPNVVRKIAANMQPVFFRKKLKKIRFARFNGFLFGVYSIIGSSSYTLSLEIYGRSRLKDNQNGK